MAIPERKANEKYTYGDYLKWPGEERWEIIEGVPYDMSPAPSRQHQRVARELLGQFWTFLRDKGCEVYNAPFDVRLPGSDEKDEDIETVVQPDIVVVCDQDKLDDRGCKGAPDLVIEILSQSTAKKDLNEKFNLYERTGVKEYWVVFPLDKVLDVYLLNQDGIFEKSATYLAQDRVKSSIFEDLEIDLTPVF